MKKTTLNILLALSLTPFLTQCVTKKDFTSLQYRLRTATNNIVEMEREINTLKGIAGKSAEKDDVAQIQQQQAEVGNTADRLNTELLRIKGRLDENVHLFRKIEKENDKLYNEFSRRIDLLTERLDQLVKDLNTNSDQLNTTIAQLNQTNEGLNKLREARAREAAQRAKTAAKAAEKAALKAREKAKMPTGPKEISPDKTKKKIKGEGKESPKISSPVVEKAEGPGKKDYDYGYSLLQQKKYREAYAIFTRYIEMNPKGKMAPNARFWLGDCLYNQKEYELAILEYQNVIADFSNHPKAPAALLKQGLAFEQLKDVETARIVFQKLLAEYPKSEQAATAQERLEALK